MLAVQMITFILERGENDYLGKTHVASEEFKKVIDKSGTAWAGGNIFRSDQIAKGLAVHSVH